mgnify:FL=1
MINKELETLAKDYFQATLENSPTSGVLRGYKEYFDKIEVLTQESIESEQKSLESFKSRLDVIEISKLNSREKVTAAC